MIDLKHVTRCAARAVKHSRVAQQYAADYAAAQSDTAREYLADWTLHRAKLAAVAAREARAALASIPPDYGDKAQVAARRAVVRAEAAATAASLWTAETR